METVYYNPFGGLNNINLDDIFVRRPLVHKSMPAAQYVLSLEYAYQLIQFLAHLNVARTHPRRKEAQAARSEGESNEHRDGVLEKLCTNFWYSTHHLAARRMSCLVRHINSVYVCEPSVNFSYYTIQCLV